MERIVCGCHATTERELLDWSESTDSKDFRDARRDLGVARKCGSCVPVLVEILYRSVG